MRYAGWLAMAALAVGAAGAPVVAAAPPAPGLSAPAGAESDLLLDARFPPPQLAVDVGALFALSPAMRDYLRDHIEPKVAAQGRHAALVEALYTKSALQLRYDATMTRNAAEAFEARAGNCLSLVVMTSAFAKALGLNVSYQRVVVDDTLDRRDDIYMAIGHVNLTLSRSRADEMGYGFRTGRQRVEPDRMTIDFLPQEDLRAVRTRTVDEATIVGMYLNNRAVELLALGEVEDAYWWAREAVLRSPDPLAAINTLGVVYTRHGDLEAAERALRRVLAREPANTLAMSNLVGVLARAGRTAESQALAATLARLDPEPPFFWFIRGRDAMRNGDYATARRAFAREVAREPQYHEFHYWLAAALAALGEDARAHEELARALASSTTQLDRKRYAAKLEKLRQATF